MQQIDEYAPQTGIYTYIYICNVIAYACNLHLWRATEVTVCNGIGMGDDNVDDPDAIVLRKRRTAITRERAFCPGLR